MGRRAGGSPRVGLAGAGHLGHDRPDRGRSDCPVVKEKEEAGASSFFAGTPPLKSPYFCPKSTETDKL